MGTATRRRAVRILTAAAVLALPLTAQGLGPETREVIEAFVARGAGARVADLIIEQDVTLYNPDNSLQHVRWHERQVIKLPRRHRVEKLMDGQREIRLVVGDRAWVRRRDGRTYEAPAGHAEGHRSHLLVPQRGTAEDLLRAWRALGIRDDRGHMTRVRGRAVAVIGARPEDRESPAVWMDADYGVVRFLTRETLPAGPALVDRVFSEHRPLVAGFFFPHRQEVFVGGKLLMLVAVGSVVVNTDPSDDLFDPARLRRAR
ncbi:MAG: hypothetical protein ACREJG_00360 [Candidatus Rokuibacteriota bacterium]